MSGTDRPRRLLDGMAPLALLGLLLALWTGLGLWIVRAAPYNSGTDEATRYVAFAAAANRWATEEDYRRSGVEHFYYPPLYFLLFAPFHGAEPEFLDRYPPGTPADPIYADFKGGSLIVSKEYLAGVPLRLVRLYRSAKLVSLLFGLGSLAAIGAALAALFPGPRRAWVVLGGLGPVILLPQFLYYQTLVNNDALLNLLGALAVLFFVLAALRAESGREAAALGWSLACAAAVGLGLLTKLSAVVLAPLPAGLAALPALGSGGGASAGRSEVARPWRRALARLALLATVVVAAGGWWPLRAALAGDPSGEQLQRLAHPWAYLPQAFSPTLLWFVLTRVARSYIALFAGQLYGIPDRIYAVYLLLAAAFLAALAAGLVLGRNRRGAPTSSPHRRLIWSVLGSAVTLNVALVVLYNTTFLAPYGRLLFPTLAASHALLALGLLRMAPSPRALRAVVLGLTLCLGALFLWVARNRLVTAVVQPAEHLVPLGIPELTPTIIPWVDALPWERPFVQGLSIPAGRLAGFRLWVLREEVLPRLGGVFRAALRYQQADGSWREARFLPVRLDENDATMTRWTDFALPEPVSLSGDTPAIFTIEASKPWLLPPGTQSYFASAPASGSPRMGPLYVGTARLNVTLAMSAVYADRPHEARP